MSRQVRAFPNLTSTIDVPISRCGEKMALTISTIREGTVVCQGGVRRCRTMSSLKMFLVSIFTDSRAQFGILDSHTKDAAILRNNRGRHEKTSPHDGREGQR